MAEPRFNRAFLNEAYAGAGQLQPAPVQPMNNWQKVGDAIMGFGMGMGTSGDWGRDIGAGFQGLGTQIQNRRAQEAAAQQARDAQFNKDFFGLANLLKDEHLERLKASLGGGGKPGPLKSWTANQDIYDPGNPERVLYRKGENFTANDEWMQGNVFNRYPQTSATLFRDKDFGDDAFARLSAYNRDILQKLTYTDAQDMQGQIGDLAAQVAKQTTTEEGPVIFQVDPQTGELRPEKTTRIRNPIIEQTIRTHGLDVARTLYGNLVAPFEGAGAGANMLASGSATGEGGRTVEGTGGGVAEGAATQTTPNIYDPRTTNFLVDPATRTTPPLPTQITDFPYDEMYPQPGAPGAPLPDSRDAVNPPYFPPGREPVAPAEQPDAWSSFGVDPSTINRDRGPREDYPIWGQPDLPIPDDSLITPAFDPGYIDDSLAGMGHPPRTAVDPPGFPTPTEEPGMVGGIPSIYGSRFQHPLGSYPAPPYDDTLGTPGRLPDDTLATPPRPYIPDEYGSYPTPGGIDDSLTIPGEPSVPGEFPEPVRGIPSIYGSKFDHPLGSYPNVPQDDSLTQPEIYTPIEPGSYPTPGGIDDALAQGQPPLPRDDSLTIPEALYGIEPREIWTGDTEVDLRDQSLTQPLPYEWEREMADDIGGISRPIDDEEPKGTSYWDEDYKGRRYSRGFGTEGWERSLLDKKRRVSKDPYAEVNNTEVGNEQTASGAEGTVTDGGVANPAANDPRTLPDGSVDPNVTLPDGTRTSPENMLLDPDAPAAGTPTSTPQHPGVDPQIVRTWQGTDGNWYAKTDRGVTLQLQGEYRGELSPNILDDRSETLAVLENMPSILDVYFDKAVFHPANPYDTTDNPTRMGSWELDGYDFMTSAWGEGFFHDSFPYVFGGIPGGPWISKDSRNAYNSLKRTLEPYLRAKSGAAVPEQELRRYYDSYIPTAFDGQEEAIDKLIKLDRFFRLQAEMIRLNVNNIPYHPPLYKDTLPGASRPTYDTHRITKYNEDGTYETQVTGSRPYNGFNDPLLSPWTRTTGLPGANTQGGGNKMTAQERLKAMRRGQ